MKEKKRNLIKRAYSFRIPGLRAQGNISIHGHGYKGPRCKVVLFDAPRDLMRFWKEQLGRPLGKNKTLGCVTDMMTEWEKIDGEGKTTSRCRVVDRLYVCIIGLVWDHCTMEVLSHESVHAAYCYAKRRHRSPWNAQAKSFDEEEIAYPAGRIAAGLRDFALKVGVYKPEELVTGQKRPRGAA